MADVRRLEEQREGNWYVVLRPGGGTVISALCTVRGTRNGLLQLMGEGTGAALNLKEAKFT